MGQPFKWFGPTIDEVGQLQQPSRMVWQAKYKKWKTNSAPAVAPTSTDGSPPRSAALSHKYKSDFTEILKNSIAEIQELVIDPKVNLRRGQIVFGAWVKKLYVEVSQCLLFGHNSGGI